MDYKFKVSEIEALMSKQDFMIKLVMSHIIESLKDNANVTIDFSLTKDQDIIMSIDSYYD